MSFKKQLPITYQQRRAIQDSAFAWHAVKELTRKWWFDHDPRLLLMPDGSQKIWAVDQNNKPRRDPRPDIVIPMCDACDQPFYSASHLLTPYGF